MLAYPTPKDSCYQISLKVAQDDRGRYEELRLALTLLYAPQNLEELYQVEVVVNTTWMMESALRLEAQAAAQLEQNPDDVLLEGRLESRYRRRRNLEQARSLAVEQLERLQANSYLASTLEIDDVAGIRFPVHLFAEPGAKSTLNAYFSQSRNGELNPRKQ